MTITKNSVVSLEYELTESGKSDIIDSNKGQAPLDFIVGKGQIIPGLESQLMDLKKGDSSDIKVNSVDAYGEINPEAVDTLPIEQFAGLELSIDLQLYGQGENGETVTATVKEFNDETVTIDFNHPLAGKDLMFSVTVLDVREATLEEIESSQIGGHGDGSCGSACECD